jgi:hypothetical protein
MSARQTRIAFSLIGGVHQFLHGAPVLAELARMPGVAVEAYVADASDAAGLHALLKAFRADSVPVIQMKLPALIERAAELFLGHTEFAKLKLPRLAAWRRQIRAADLIVTLERTSTILKQLPGHCPPIAHIPHGAGDRAKGYEGRFRYFDHVLVAGEKDRSRMIEFGLVKPEQITATGYIKLAGLRRIHGDRRPRLFQNDRPTVLYNPHFDTKLGSWEIFGESVIEQFSAQRRFNLIVAPHVRLFEQASPAERARWEGLSDPDWLLFDAGSERSMDMTYTLAADIYLGDVSSQVYEFCANPRPCVFINAHGVKWRDDPHYAMWHLGDVISKKRELMPAIDAAWAQPDRKREEQIAAVRNSFGEPEVDAAEVAANCLIKLAQGVRPSSRQPA